MEYSIEGGTYKLNTISEGIDTYVYRFTDKEGEHTVVFLASVVPKIGDRIVDGVHIPLTEYKINNDTSKWNEYYNIKFPDNEDPDYNHYL